MVSFVSIALAALAYSDSFFHVVWTDANRSAVSIRAEGLVPEVEECLDSGRDAKVRFEVRLCRKRSSWFDACATERSELHTVSYDMITETYRVKSDRHGDESDPATFGAPSRKAAVDSAVTTSDFSMDFLARDDEKLLKDERPYLQARTVFVCKGSVNRTFNTLSQIVTFGLVNVTESDSGWGDFPVSTSISSEKR